MKPDRLKYGVWQNKTKKRQDAILMQVIGVMIGRAVGAMCQKMAQVVQKCRADEMIVRAFGLRKRAALQCMLKLGDGLAAIGQRTVRPEQASNIFEIECHRSS